VIRAGGVGPGDGKAANLGTLWRWRPWRCWRSSKLRSCCGLIC